MIRVAQVAGWMTPRIGGVGPMTVAMLLQNTVIAAEKSRRLIFARREYSQRHSKGDEDATRRNRADFAIAKLRL